MSAPPRLVINRDGAASWVWDADLEEVDSIFDFMPSFEIRVREVEIVVGVGENPDAITLETDKVKPSASKEAR